MIRLTVMLMALALPLQAETIRLASTTSTQNSGLLAAILPIFEERTGHKVEVIAVGTGQALRIARNGDADVLLVHHRTSEDAFVAEGHGLERFDVMYNDFVIVGPTDDPADVAGAGTAVQAFQRIAEAGVAFASRGDDSGTHKKEQELWQAAEIQPQGDWYRETGAGMGTTLNIAVAMGAYVLTDRGTWITFGNKRAHNVRMSGDKVLFNPYGIIAVNPDRHPHVKSAASQALIEWFLSDEGQAAIGAFTIEGQQAFCPNSVDMQRARAAARVGCPVDQDSLQGG
ncbi:ABC transporter substrate-binding protein [Halovulum sp. GXIMD14793]